MGPLPLELNDTSGSFGVMDDSPVNVLGEPLGSCSTSPMTGFYRDG